MYLFNLFFDALNNSGISYAITGRTEEYPEHIHSDIDIIIPSEQFELFWAFMGNLDKHFLNWIQVISHESSAYYCIVCLSDGTKNELIKPDVCSNYYRKESLFLKADYLLSGKLFNNKGFYQLAPDKEFIYYLLKKIDKENINDEQFEHLKNQWIQNSQGCLAASSSFFSVDNQNIISKSFENNTIAFLIKNIDVLKKELRQNIPFNFKDKVLKIHNRITRILEPTGLIVGIVGSNDALKTIVVDALKTNLTEAFRQNKRFNFYSTSKPNKNRWFYFISYWFKIFPLKVRSTLIILDFYSNTFLDLMGKNNYVSQPDLWIFLDDTIQEIQQKQAFYINSNINHNQVIYDVEQVIIDYLKKRTISRYRIQ